MICISNLISATGTGRLHTFLVGAKFYHTGTSDVWLSIEDVRFRIVAKNEKKVTVRTRAANHCLLAKGCGIKGNFSMGLTRKSIAGVFETRDRKEATSTEYVDIWKRFKKMESSYFNLSIFHLLDIFTVKRRLRDYRREMGSQMGTEYEPGLKGRSGRVVITAIVM